MSGVVGGMARSFPATGRRVTLGEITTECTARNASRGVSQVRSVTNDQGLVPTTEVFDNVRTSADTKAYKVVSPGMFVYNPSRINVGSIAWLKEPESVIVSPMYVVFDIDRAVVLPEYLDLFFRSSVGRRSIEGRTEVGARFRLPFASLAQIAIVVPSLEEQKLVIRTLDAFLRLIANLEAELDARRHQFAHYRDSLLAELASASATVPMGALGRFIRGRRFTKTDLVTEGLPCIHYGEIYTSYGVGATRARSHVRPEMAEMLRFAHPGDVVIAAVGETAEDVAKALAWLGHENVAIHDDCFAFRHEMNPRFVAYCLQTSAFHEQKAKFVARGKVNRLSGEALAKIAIPAPSRAEQDQLVAVLDTFDALVSDLSIGIPAEINARRKQYAYYRDKLLTFEEAPA
jgi:type I restriction enzyme, S subunit